jgi:hypothetical protein
VLRIRVWRKLSELSSHSDGAPRFELTRRDALSSGRCDAVGEVWGCRESSGKANVCRAMLEVHCEYDRVPVVLHVHVAKTLPVAPTVHTCNGKLYSTCSAYGLYLPLAQCVIQYGVAAAQFCIPAKGNLKLQFFFLQMFSN